MSSPTVVSSRSGVGRRVLVMAATMLVFVLAATGGIVIVNATVLGPGGFVRVYLDALARGDVAGALSMPGVDPGAGDPSLLRREAVTPLVVGEIDLLGERGGVHLVEARWSTEDESGTTRFEVERVGTTAGFFPQWAFVRSPMSSLALTLRHETRVTVNDLDVQTESVSAAPHVFAVLVPGVYDLRHESRWLRSDEVRIMADQPGATVEAAVAAEANDALRTKVEDFAHRQLDGCAVQEVLFPTGCPFGQFIADRVASAPTWTIVDYPRFEIAATTRSPRWRAEGASGLAQLSMKVQSIFDGGVSPFDADVPFELVYELHFGAGDRLTIAMIETD